MIAGTLTLRYVAGSALTIVVGLFGGILDAYAANSCVPAMAWVVSVQGIVEVRRFKQKSWQPTLLKDALCPGDMVRVRERSRAALWLSNESVFRMDQKTTLTLAEPDTGKGTLLEIVTGALHVLTRTPKPFQINTPFLNAGVDGTEFFIRVDQNQTRLVLYEGKISASNEHGSLILADNEAAVAIRSQAPRKEVLVRPFDAVQWALFYPTIINPRLDEQMGDESTGRSLRASVELSQKGSLTDALAMLYDVPTDRHTPQFLTYRAGLLLSVGRADEAKADIEKALHLEPGSSDAIALRAVIAVVQNTKEQALVLASHAVNLNPISSAARLALSYAQQAHFKIEEALESVKKAVEIDPQNALTWARLAELHMSTGYLDLALEAAQRAVNLDPGLSKTQTVLGFAYLVQIDTDAAKTAFAKAIALDQADPMPRLGMGLAKIRENDLEAGRIELEIAAGLDPANSLIRSYLGKAYFEEKRYSLAGTQFNLAKERDPNDPTPWLYDGIMKQTQNQPGGALRDIQKSIDLNQNRAVYRSQLLLDQDQAARSSSLARIYDNLGFEKRALMETARSLSLDPSSHSAHRFLSDAYLNVPRHEIARVSELLQAQLLQPINLNPVQPQLAVADLNIITGAGPTRAGFNEFAPLVERNKPQVVTSGIFGSHSTLGDETVLSALYGRASVSIGQFHYDTKGFRPNNDQTHNVYNAFVQYVVTPRFNVQAEIRTRKSEHGDLLLDFDPRAFKTGDRRELSQDTARIGARFTLSPHQDLIGSVMYVDRNENKIDSGFISARGNPFNYDSLTKDQGYQAETQYLFRGNRFNAIAGAGIYQIGVKQQIHQHFVNSGNIFCAIPCASDFNRDRGNAYVYTNSSLPKNVSMTVGLSYDSFKEGNSKVEKLNPKFGLQWDITPGLRLRLAWFEVIKSALIANQTLEPTQVAGFNQLFDDLNGTKARRMGIGLDAHSKHKLYSGFELSRRELHVPSLSTSLDLEGMNKQQESLYRAYFYWLPHSEWAVRLEPQFEKFTRAITSDNDPFRIETFSAPLSFNYFSPYGIFAKFTTTYTRQNLERPVSSTLKAGSDDFFLLDAAIGYRFPKRRGILSLEGKNLLNEEFFYRNYNFQVNEAISPRFTPGRTVFLRLTLNF